MLKKVSKCVRLAGSKSIQFKPAFFDQTECANRKNGFGEALPWKQVEAAPDEPLAPPSIIQAE
jgi:hypothetical protein